VLLAVVVTLGLIFASGSSYLSILVTGELMRDIFRRLGLAAENLSRTLEDSGTVVAPLVPWGVSGLFMTSTLGVSTWDYGLFAAMNYLGFAFAALYGYTGWFIRLSDERSAR
jgi:NhaC family Na+:H+ antiporter